MRWEVDATKLDTETRPEYVIERILEYGTLEGVIWLRRNVGDEKIADFVTGLGRKRLFIRTLNFWQKIFRVPEHKCMTISSMKNRSPFWNY
ncbi:hypothetical protein MJD09_23995 [bacterium]|nr:hypothetical protein [bacterium]